jgi:hypothetical protein
VDDQDGKTMSDQQTLDLTREPTLHETLAELGWSSEDVPEIRGRRVRCAQGHVVGVLSAAMVWAELRARGLIAGDQEEPEDRFHCACSRGT